jgi:hypothetical protein
MNHKIQIFQNRQNLLKPSINSLTFENHPEINWKFYLANEKNLYHSLILNFIAKNKLMKW